MNNPPKIIVKGPGLDLQPLGRYPAGRLYAGGFDAFLNTVYLSMPGHPQGMSAAGGNPSQFDIAGITLFVRADRTVFWANDSQSLTGRLGDLRFLIQRGLEQEFSESNVIFVDTIDKMSEHP